MTKMHCSYNFKNSLFNHTWVSANMNSGLDCGLRFGLDFGLMLSSMMTISNNKLP